MHPRLDFDTATRLHRAYSEAHDKIERMLSDTANHDANTRNALRNMKSMVVRKAAYYGRIIDRLRPFRPSDNLEVAR